MPILKTEIASSLERLIEPDMPANIMMLALMESMEFPRFRGQVSGLHKIDCRGRRKALLVIDWTEETDR